MRIGIPREIKIKESRVALLPPEVRRLTAAGHDVLVEHNAGLLAGAGDEDYAAAGARIAADGASLYAGAEMIVKVKEILRPEFAFLRPDHTIIANLYCERDRVMLDRFLEVGLTAIAAEKAHPQRSGNSPLAGEIAALEGLRLVLLPHGGTGRHFMRHAGVEAARVIVVGLGLAGRGALRTLMSLGVSVVGLDHNETTIARARLDWENRDFTAAHVDTIAQHLPEADLVINCVRWDKSRSDHLITRQMLSTMRRGAVIVDVACDRAGAIETSMPTSWENPTYQVAGVTHFCVENLPSAAPRASSVSFADLISTLVEPIANLGLAGAVAAEDWLGKAVICHAGKVVSRRTATLQKLEWTPLADALAASAEEAR